MYTLYAVDSNNNFHMIRKSGDIELLDKIVERNDGIWWVGGEACSFQIVYDNRNKKISIPA